MPNPAPADVLAPLRSRYLLPPGVIYLDGNSLGPVAAGVPERITEVVQRQWGTHLIRAWNADGWWQAPQRIGERIAPLLGAGPGQVIAGDTTSVQLFQALVAAARLRPGRRVLISESGHFPTDTYLAASVARLLDLTLVRVPAAGIEAALADLGETVAAVSCGVVDYRTGELRDVTTLTAASHEAGALAVWDLSHAAGALPLRLDADRVDLAVGCGYKYLSGGPGAPAFLYVATRHQERFDHPLTGWHGHAAPFAMADDYLAAPGIARARVGTPPMLSLLALEASLAAFDGVDLQQVRAQSLALTGYLIEAVEEFAAAAGLRLVTPREPERRGSQVSYEHQAAPAVMAALIEAGVIGDLRPPSLLRFGVNALYVSPADLTRAVTVLREVIESGRFREPRYRAAGEVT